MELIGYVRVSTREQNEARQVQKMRDLGVTERFLFLEKQSGKDFERPVYQAMCNVLRPGDLLIIDSIDRLGRNYEQVKDEWKRLTRDLGVDVVALDMPGLFDSRRFKEMGDIGKLMEDQMLSLLAWVAEQERTKMLQRQREGIAVAKEKGVYKGRKPVAIPDFDKHYERYISRKVSKAALARELGISRPTVDRLIREYVATLEHNG
ncbi:DNA recombinase [Oscillospiraceae bacterium]|nr:DNA recombinase [Oscillospiraceae bacterium]BDF75787.1 DNA recombinase [Oscillospiraceae bacterium]